MATLSLNCNQSQGKSTHAPHLLFRMVQGLTSRSTTSGEAGVKEPFWMFVSSIHMSSPTYNQASPPAIANRRLQRSVCMSRESGRSSMPYSPRWFRQLSRYGKPSHCFLQMARLLSSYKMGPAKLLHCVLATLSRHILIALPSNASEALAPAVAIPSRLPLLTGPSTSSLHLNYVLYTLLILNC